MTLNGKFPTLVCGNPEKDAASFTRFVFPFAYKPERCREEAGGLYFREPHVGPEKNEEPLINRRKYFTAETRKVLFENARWLEMNPEPDPENTNPEKPGISGWNQTIWAKGVCLKCTKKTVKVRMLPPRLVLFEWNEPGPKKDADDPFHMDIFQTGFLLVDLYFDENSNEAELPGLDELLQINDLFRYFDCPHDKHAQNYSQLLEHPPVEYLKKEKSEQTKIEPGNIHDAYHDLWVQLLTYPVRLNSDTYKLVPESFPERAKKFIGKGISENGVSKHFVYADNRTYIWSAAIIEDFPKSLQRALRTNEHRAHEFGHWIKFLNVDPPDKDGCPSNTHKKVGPFEKQWAKDRTYRRWEQLGTWYGFCYHAGVMMAAYPKKEDDPPTCRHFRGLYFDIAILLFYIRVTLFRFSRLLTDITDKNRKKRDNENDRQLMENFTKLRRKFLEFAILYQFPLLSNQQQGIEMYALARTHFDIEELFREIKQEIDHTHDFLVLEKSRQIGEAGNKLNKVAAIFASWGLALGFGALISAVLSINPNQAMENLKLKEILPYLGANLKIWWVLIVPIVFVGILGVLFRIGLKRIMNKKD